MKIAQGKEYIFLFLIIIVGWERAQPNFSEIGGIFITVLDIFSTFSGFCICSAHMVVFHKPSLHLPISLIKTSMDPRVFAEFLTCFFANIRSCPSMQNTKKPKYKTVFHKNSY